MARNIRSRNLDLLRWLNYGHKHVASKLAGLTNSAYISKMAVGDMPIETGSARAMERILEMPKGWMDRDNVSVIQMNELDYALHEKISGLSEDAKAGLLTFLSSRPIGFTG